MPICKIQKICHVVFVGEGGQLDHKNVVMETRKHRIAFPEYNDEIKEYECLWLGWDAK